MKELENCLKKLDRRGLRKRRNWVTQQKAEVNNLELRSQRGVNVGEIAAEVLRNEMRPSSSSQLLLANLFSRTESHLLFAWCLSEVASEDLNSCDKMKNGDNSLHVYQMMMHYVAAFSSWENTRAPYNKSETIPLRRDSRETILVLGG